MLIAHRCRVCDHLDTHNRSGRCCEGRCRRCRHSPCDYGPPQIVPTFDEAGNVQAIIVPPGTRASRGLEPCNCADCNALYATETQQTQQNGVA